MFQRPRLAVDTVALPDATVQLESSFFELGGTSISAIRLINWIQESFGQRLELATIFTEATLIEQAIVLREQFGASSVL